jgi:hypothetical protein
LRDGSTEALDAENREAAAKGIRSSQKTYLASLLRHRKANEALEYIRTLPDAESFDMTLFRVVFLVDGHLDAAREECRRAMRNTHPSVGRESLLDALSLVGLEQEAREQAEILARNPPLQRDWDDFQSFQSHLFSHAYGGAAMDVEAAVGESRWKRHLANQILGFAALSRGDRAGACSWFKADEHSPITFGNRPWKLAIRERVLANDPVWPPWIAGKK